MAAIQVFCSPGALRVAKGDVKWYIDAIFNQIKHVCSPCGADSGQKKGSRGRLYSDQAEEQPQQTEELWLTLQ